MVDEVGVVVARRFRRGRGPSRPPRARGGRCRSGRRWWRSASNGSLLIQIALTIWIAYTISTCPTVVLTRKERQEQTREQLVEAAARVFARRGYHRATVDEIAAEAGFTIGALYSNFETKEKLFLAIADRQVETRVSEISAVADAAVGDGEAGAEAAAQLGPSSRPIPTGRSSSTSSGRSACGTRRWAIELAERRDAIRDALAETLKRVAKHHGFKSPLPGAGPRHRDRRLPEWARPSSAPPILTRFRTRCSRSSLQPCSAARSRRPVHERAAAPPLLKPKWRR